MNTLKKIGKWALYLFGGIITLILIILFIIRVNSSGIEEPFLDENGKVLANSIAMHEDIEINGARQRITIRGKNAEHPVLLRVHGGPGSAIPPVITRINGFDLEDLFVVCYWDQRGAGLGYSNDIPDSTITLTQIVEDGLWVANYLREKFGADKIYIEGSSWGTTVSAYMVQKNIDWCMSMRF